MIQRMIGAALFNAETYEDIEADRGAMGQAILVVVLVTICGIIGGIIDGLLGDGGGQGIVRGAIVGLIRGVVLWAIWVSMLSLVGGMMLRTGSTNTSWAEIGRVVGFAYSPGVLSIFSFVPLIGWLFPIVTFVWTMAAVTMAVRQALDFESTGRAIAVVLLSALIPLTVLIVAWVILFLLSVGNAGIAPSSSLLRLAGLA